MHSQDVAAVCVDSLHFFIVCKLRSIDVTTNELIIFYIVFIFYYSFYYPYFNILFVCLFVLFTLGQKSKPKTN